MENDMKSTKIRNCVIGDGQNVFVVAEIGGNHNGDIKIAKRLIDMAIDCGCDAVKFQKRTPEICVPEDQKHVMKETPWGLIPYIEYRRLLEFGEKEYSEINEYCSLKKIIWFATPWDIPSVDFLERYDVPCYKIASASLTDFELIKKIKSQNKPIILSTGMSTIEQIDKAVDYIGLDNLIVMHCNSSYPAREDELNLNVIKTFKSRYNCPIGYSGHESGMFPSVVAVAMGACIIERHITLDRAMWGSDQAASLSRQGLQYICSTCKIVPDYLGDGIKRVYDSEKTAMKKLRRIQ
jgi:N-acetylneuraminate synthase